jgi:LuxR family transcriptional regulator, maltose regulon positive regulatory protein
VTVVTGAPGAGKTVLLERWAGRSATDITQLQLADDDNNPHHFWKRVSSAFLPPSERWRSCFVVHDEAAVRRRRTAAHNLLACLVDMAPTTVVLDNFQLIGNPEVFTSFAWFLCTLPRHIHVVIAGRDASHLPLQRLRSNGRLTEIRGDDLRFSTEETNELFNLSCARAVSDDAVKAFTRLTDGWAAGLGRVGSELTDLVSVSDALRHLEDGHLTDDYFSREILSGFSAEDEIFLLTTSVLDRMTGDLCQELTGRADAIAIMESLAGRNLFVNRLDSVGRWYGFHPLFARFLRRRLHRHDPTAARRAQTSAASWFHRHGDLRAAMHYQVHAGAPDEAFSLGVSALVQRVALGAALPSEAPGFSSGLTEAYLGADAYRSYMTAAGLLYSGRRSEGAEWLRHLELALREHPERQLWLRRSECLWALHDTLHGDAVGALSHCSHTAPLREGGTDASPIEVAVGPSPIDAVVSSTHSVVAARAFLTLGQPEEARAELARQRRDVQGLASMPYLAVSALLASAEGRLSDATTLARRALDMANFSHATPSLATLDAHLALGISSWERHQLDVAAEALEGALQHRRSAPGSPVFWPVDLQLIRVMVSQGRAVEALPRISVLRRELDQEGRSWPHVSQLNELESRCWLLLGDFERARKALNSDQSPHILALIDLYSNEPEKAVARLAEPATSILDLGADLERLTLMATAKVELGREREALTILREALERGRPDGFVRPFVGCSTKLIPLLRRILGGLPDNYLRKVIIHTEQATLPDHPYTPRDLPRLLSIREQEILTYLPSHRSLGDIANELYVSPNTVKSHVQALYRKLGAHTRSQAVANARALRLL